MNNMNEYIVVVQAIEKVTAESADEAKRIALDEAIKHADMDLEAANWIIIN